MEPPDPAALLLYTLLDVRNRQLRFLGAIEELRRTSVAGESEVLSGARDSMISALSSFEGELRDVLDPVLTESPDPDDDYGLSVRRSALTLGENGFNAYARVQRDVFPYLALGPRPPADVGFFLARAFGLSPTEVEDRRSFALTYGRYPAWDSRIFDSPAPVAGIPIPIGETLTPLRWPLLVHELAHWFQPGGERLRQTAERALLEAFHRDDLPVSLSAPFGEFYADLVAYRTCGPSYVYALAKEAHLASAENRKSDEFSPSMRVRLRLLGSEVQPFLEGLPEGWLPPQSEVEDFDALVRVHEVAQRLLEELPAQETRDEVIGQITALLKNGEPASGVHMSNEPSLGVLAEVVRTRRDGDATLRNNVFGSAVDTAGTDAEILVAAWLGEVDRPSQQIYADLEDSPIPEAGEPTTAEELERAIGVLAARDTAVSRSLAAGAVHRWLTRYDETIERAASLTPQWGASGYEEFDHWQECSPLADIHILRRLRHPDDAERLVVRPLLDPDQIGATTVDLRLGTEWETLRPARFQALDPGDNPTRLAGLLDSSYEEFRLTIGQGQELVLHPGELILALTLEYMRLPENLWANLEGRSTWARLGLQVHATAGMIDCGFEGYITLELQNTGRLPLVLVPGLRVGQLALFPVDHVVRPYNRKTAAAYSAQTRARTAFPRQHEHKALWRARSEQDDGSGKSRSPG